MRDNIILADNPAYTAEDQGLLTIQPYNKDTTSLKNMTVVIKNNTLASEQVGYFGYGANDLVITDENKAKIIIMVRLQLCQLTSGKNKIINFQLKWRNKIWLNLDF